MTDIEMILQADMEFEEMWWAEHPDAGSLYRDQHHDEIVAEKKAFIREWLRNAEEARNEAIAELEEHQHKTGFYRFQDQMDMMRFER